MRKLLSAMTGLAGTVLWSSHANAVTGENGFAIPEQSWEVLWHEVMVDITVIGVIMAVAAVIMLIKYKATSPDQVGTAKKLTTAQSIAFALIPASIFMADDFFLAAKGWTVFNDYRRVPDSAMEIKVTAYQWYFEFEYPDGQVTDELVMPHNQPVVLRMTSADVIHNFGIPAFRNKEDVMPGRITYIYINPVDIKDTFVQCAEFCGTAHSEMYTAVRVVSQADYDAWLEEQS